MFDDAQEHGQFVRPGLNSLRSLFSLFFSLFSRKIFEFCCTGFNEGQITLRKDRTPFVKILLFYLKPFKGQCSRFATKTFRGNFESATVVTLL